jgi:hypothetical protein
MEGMLQVTIFHQWYQQFQDTERIVTKHSPSRLSMLQDEAESINHFRTA